MISQTSHIYKLIVEQPYCCVPATIQMVLERRKLSYETQEKIGNQLGLIVPPDLASRFCNVRTGPEPVSGYGTQISKEEFSIENYFQQQSVLLKIEIRKPDSVEDLEEIINSAMKNDNDIAICYDSKQLFGDGDPEHFSLVQSINEIGCLEIIDPAIGAPPLRITTVQKLFDVLKSHKVSAMGGVWIFSTLANG